MVTLQCLIVRPLYNISTSTTKFCTFPTFIGLSTLFTQLPPSHSHELLLLLSLLQNTLQLHSYFYFCTNLLHPLSPSIHQQPFLQVWKSIITKSHLNGISLPNACCHFLVNGAQ